jgi:hypothetical protein
LIPPLLHGDDGGEQLIPASAATTVGSGISEVNRPKIA